MQDSNDEPGKISYPFERALSLAISNGSDLEGSMR
jgi:hypothetical protein